MAIGCSEMFNYENKNKNFCDFQGDYLNNLAS